MALTDQQRQHLEARLREERARAVRIIEQEDEDQSDTPAEQAGDLSSIPFHMADVGTETQEQEMGEVMRQRASDELREIDEALRRLVESPERYGLDEETGEPIGFERLELIPWARTRAPAVGGPG
jgi:DnaK suppressor protein